LNHALSLARKMPLFLGEAARQNCDLSKFLKTVATMHIFACNGDFNFMFWDLIHLVWLFFQILNARFLCALAKIHNFSCVGTDLGRFCASTIIQKKLFFYLEHA